MDKERLIQAWNFVALAAKNSNGNADYHERLKAEINYIAAVLTALVEEDNENDN
jgi:hypothetical protein